MSGLLHSLKELRSSGCHLCAYERFQAQRFLEGIANDGINDPPLRQRLRQKGGFCPRHLEVFVDHARVLSSAILLEDLVSHRIERSRLGKASIPTHCEACDIERKTRDNLAKSIRRSKEDRQFLNFLQEQHLCLSHIELITHQLPEIMRYPFSEKYQQVLDHLAEIIRKHDYRFIAEGIGDEETKSIQKALGLLSSS